MTNTVAAQLPFARAFDNSGLPLAAGLLYTYQAGTLTPLATYQDYAGGTPNTNPVVLDSTGQATVRYLPQAYKLVLKDPTGTTTLDSLDNFYPPLTDFSALSTSTVGQLLFPETAAETSAGLTVTNFAIPPYPINVLRYGITPNNTTTGVVSSNTSTLQALLNYSTTGPTGLLVFPNTTGSDTYTFSGVCTVRQFLHIDLCGCTISVTGSSTSNDVNTGFFYALSDIIIENGTITTAVNTALGTNAAACIALGARGTGFYYTVFDSTQAAGKSLGRITLRNLTLVNNNTGGFSNAMVQILGGMSNVLLENITVSCNSVTNNTGAPGGIYYEWGWATSPASTSTTQCSNGHNMRFSNIRITNCPGVALGLTGAYNAVVDGLYTNGCNQAFVYSIGEAMFYLPWTGVDTYGAKRNIHLLNVVAQGTTTGPALQLAGSNLGSATFYGTHGVSFTPSQQTDLMTFTLDNVAVPSMSVGGEIIARNCKFDAGGSFLNPVTINDDCMYAQFENCNILNGTGAGVRADLAGSGVWSPIRQKFLYFVGGLVAGNQYGFELNNTQVAHLKQVRIGFNSLNDPANESAQSIGVLVDSGCNGVIADGCFVTTSGGNAYSIIGTSSSGCSINNPQGTVTSAGQWEFNNVANASGTNLASKTAVPNVGYKYFGKLCVNSSTNKMFVAQGATSTSTWISVDGGTTITPS